MTPVLVKDKRVLKMSILGKKGGGDKKKQNGECTFHKARTAAFVRIIRGTKQKGMVQVVS